MPSANVGIESLRSLALLLRPEAAAALPVLAGLLSAACIVKAPATVRWAVIGIAMLMLVGGATLRGFENGPKLLAADCSIVFGLTLLVVTAGLKRLPPGLARMARAAGAGDASVFLHTVVRPSAWRAVACTAMSILLIALDFGLLTESVGAGGMTQALMLSGCAVLALGLVLGPRPA
jgi:hypothetical protein